MIFYFDPYFVILLSYYVIYAQNLSIFASITESKFVTRIILKSHNFLSSLIESSQSLLY